MDYDILPPTDDWIFKLLFGDERSKAILTGFLKSIIDLPDEEYDITYLDTYLKPEFEDDKLGIIDVKVQTKTKQIIDIEIQVNPTRELGKRLSFYKSKLITEQINKAELYDTIHRVICICITNFTVFPTVSDYLTDFRFYNRKNDFYFDAIPEIIYMLELPKVPKQSDGTLAWEWSQFLRAKKKGEFEMVAEKNPVIREAVDTLYEISADEKVRKQYEFRLKMQRDHEMFIHNAYLNGIEEGEQKGVQQGIQQGIYQTARNMKSSGMSIGEISKFTGLSEQEIGNL